MNSEEALMKQVNKGAYSEDVVNKMHQSIEKFKNTDLVKSRKLNMASKELRKQIGSIKILRK